MIEIKKNNLLRVVIGGMACLCVSACWFAMNIPDEQKVNANSENSRQFYY